MSASSNLVLSFFFIPMEKDRFRGLIRGLIGRSVCFVTDGAFDGVVFSSSVRMVKVTAGAGGRDDVVLADNDNVDGEVG